MKILFRRLHLYLGFVAGLVIMTICFTGAVLVFEEELQYVFYKDRYFVNPHTVARPIEDMLSAVKQNEPGSLITGVKIYTDSNRSAEIFYTIAKDHYKKKEKPGSKYQDINLKPVSKEGIRLIAYVNPYTAEIIELYNYRNSFFFSMMSMHRWLLNGRTGKLIVGISTLIFLFILITGIILWWPKTHNVLQQRLKIKWKSGWKRLNHDLHIVLGFYSAIFLFILAFTGLTWSFQWFNKGIYKITGKSIEQPNLPVTPYHSDSILLNYDKVLYFMKTQATAVKFYNISAPKDSVSAYSVNVLRYDAPHESASDTYLIDRYNPSILGNKIFSEGSLGQKIRSAFKPVHTASIWGTTSKLIGFFVCICGVIFPATGYTMWWLRTRKNVKNARTTS